MTPTGFDNAFGLICQFYGQMLHVPANALITGIQDTANALQGAQAGINAVATAYDETDRQISQRLSKIHEGIRGITPSSTDRRVGPASPPRSGGTP